MVKYIHRKVNRHWLKIKYKEFLHTLRFISIFFYLRDWIILYLLFLRHCLLILYVIIFYHNFFMHVNSCVYKSFDTC